MLKFYNTLSRKKENFKPIKSGTVSLYGCGPTVYWYQHIGNMRRYIFEDILRRTLLFNKFKVKHVINITDVGHLTSDADEGEDKMMKAIKREKLPPTSDSLLKLARKYEESFLDDAKKLNIQSPDKWARATEHIKEMINLIKKIEKNGYTYKTKVGLIFDTSKAKDYTKLAKLKLENMKAGSRVEIDPERKNPSDFALWITNQPKHIMQWDSPWGKGFPGWHIECSAMSTKYLGDQFDIHTGGEEHIPIHHTNEIAQSEAACGKHPWVNYWLHMRWLVLKDGKMSKSEGKVFTISELEKKGYDPLDFRYLSLQTHYRKRLLFSLEALDSAKNTYDRLKNIILELKIKKDSKKTKNNYKKEFLEGINDDLNTSKALSVLWGLLRDQKLGSKEKLELAYEFDNVLGLSLKEIKEEKIAEEIKDLAERRQLARETKDWEESDKLRDEINSRGYEIKDSKEGYLITKK
jgi:cysteinyl-tRNA synthetase